MQAIITASAAAAAADLIVNPIYRAAITSPHSRLDRRMFKFVEEFGEVVEAFLDLSGSNRKAKTADDLLEEKVDLFVVSSDILLQHARANGLDTAAVRADMTKNLAFHIERLPAMEHLGFDHDAGIVLVSTNLGKAMLDMSIQDVAIRDMSLLGLHEATTQLMLVPEELEWPHAAANTAQRLQKLADVVRTKVAKWEMTRALPNAA